MKTLGQKQFTYPSNSSKIPLARFIETTKRQYEAQRTPAPTLCKHTALAVFPHRFQVLLQTDSTNKNRYQYKTRPTDQKRGSRNKAGKHNHLNFDQDIKVHTKERQHLQQRILELDCLLIKTKISFKWIRDVNVIHDQHLRKGRAHFKI